MRIPHRWSTVKSDSLAKELKKNIFLFFMLYQKKVFRFSDFTKALPECSNSNISIFSLAKTSNISSRTLAKPNKPQKLFMCMSSSFSFFSLHPRFYNPHFIYPNCHSLCVISSFSLRSICLPIFIHYCLFFALSIDVRLFISHTISLIWPARYHA